MDLRGHGGSGPPPGPFSWDDLAGDLVALLDALDLRECLVVGHSRERRGEPTGYCPALWTG